MTTIKLSNVRLSYPYLIEKFDNKKYEPKYLTNIVISKDSEEFDLVNDIIKNMIQILGKVESDRICFQDASENFKDSYILRTSNSNSPVLIDQDKVPVTDKDKFYGGCYVNALIDIWYQTSFGKRINATILGVQFVKDGEVFTRDLSSDLVLAEFDLLKFSSQNVYSSDETLDETLDDGLLNGL